MNKEEYRKYTDIEDVGEAEDRLGRTKVLFVVAFASMFAMEIASYFEDLASLVAYFAFLAFYLYFLVHCYQLVKDTKKVATTSSFWAVVMAPFSWIWFYPELVKPLKIIIGTIEPPETLQSAKDKKKKNNVANKRAIGIILVVLGIGLGLMLVAYFSSL